MKKILLAALLALLALLPSAAFGQCSGQFAANQVCGSIGGGLPTAIASTSVPAGVLIVGTTVVSGASGGQVLYGNGGALGSTAALTLGASGTPGSLTLGNATSGLVTLQPVTGALGTVTVTLPAATDQLVGRATTDTLTNKTLTSPVLTTPSLGVATATSINGLTITSSTGTLTITNAKTLSVSNSLTFTGTDSTSFAFPGASGTIAELNLAQAWTAIQTVSITPAANTSGDGLVLLDPTAASAGNQQFSPRLRLSGQGWKTTATAASQQVDFILENQTVQGTSAPSGNLVISAQVNSGGYTALYTFGSDGGLTLGAPTGGDKGAGTINVAGGLYVNNVSTSGATNPGTAGQIAYYATSAAVVSGDANATISSGALTLGSPGVAGSLILNGSSSGTATIATTSTGSGVVFSQLYGGTAAGSTLTLTSTSNGSPSGDSITMQAGGVSMLQVLGTNGGQVIVGQGTFTPYSGSIMEWRTGTNQRFSLGPKNTLSSGSAFQLFNDAINANVGLEFRASTVGFSVGSVCIYNSSNFTGTNCSAVAGQLEYAGSLSIASASGATLDAIYVAADTTTITGTTGITTAGGFNKMTIYTPTYTDSSSVTVTNAATLAIQSAPAAAGSVTITNAYALWVQGGKTLLAGSLVNSGIASSAQADVVCTTSAGLLSYQVSATGCAASSERYKDMRAPLTREEIEHVALGLVQAKRWTYRNPDFGDPSEYVGFTAEQVAAIDDRFITRDASGLPYAVKHQQLAETAIAGFAMLLQDMIKKDRQLPRARHPFGRRFGG